MIKIDIGMETKSKQIWDGLSQQEKISCLKQARSGVCDAPMGLPVEVWRSITHYLKSEKLARVAHIEGGDCEAISLTDDGVALLWQIERKTDEKPIELELPCELDTEQARKYFARAVTTGWMNEQFGWLKRKTQLGYFCSKIYPHPRPLTALERFFDVKKLSSDMTNAEIEPKRADVKKWRAKLDTEIFFD